MKIVYSLSDRLGAGLLLSRFLHHNTHHEIRIAGFAASTKHLAKVDWTLDALYFNFKGEKFKSREFRALINAPQAPKINTELAELMLEDLEKFNPDLVICDNEPVVSHMGNFLGFKLWYYSPLHLLDGFKWPHKNFLKSTEISQLKKELQSLPKPEKYFIPGWFGQMLAVPSLKSNFYWVEPEMSCLEKTNIFHDEKIVISNLSRKVKLQKILKTLNNVTYLSSSDFLHDNRVDSQFCITSGESVVVSDLLFQQKFLCLIPETKDVEGWMQAQICKLYGLGVDLNQLELLENLAVQRLEDCYFSVPLKNNNLFKRGVFPTLSQKVEELCNM